MLWLVRMDKSRLQSKHLEEVGLVGGPWCGMTYAILKASNCNQIEVPGGMIDNILGSFYHLYQRDEEEGMLFYYVGDIEVEHPNR